jgi:hypothetical protein
MVNISFHKIFKPLYPNMNRRNINESKKSHMPATGFETEFLSVTKTQPKEMHEVFEKPTI